MKHRLNNLGMIRFLQFLLLGLLLCANDVLHAQEPQKWVSRKVERVWKAAGADVAWIQTPEGPVFIPDKVDISLLEPNFYFRNYEPGIFKNLPEPEVAFSISLCSSKFTDTRLSELRRFKNLSALYLEETKVSGTGLKELAGRQLKVLKLPNEAMTSSTLKHYLSAIDPDGTIDLSWWKIDDTSLKELLKFGDLKKLDMSYTPISDAGLKIIAKLTNLDALDLQETNVTKKGLKYLSSLKRLESLSLENTSIGDAGLKELTQFPNLKKAYLGETKITDVGLNELAKCKQLRILSLFHTQITDKGLQILAGMRLKYLVIDDKLFTDLGLKNYLSAVEPPTNLNLKKTRITDVGLKEIGKLKELSDLDLAATQITDSGLKELLQLQRLTRLCLRQTSITDDALPTIAKIKKLDSLDLSNTAVTDIGLKALAGRKLQSLQIPLSAQTDLGLANYLAAFETPTSLDLHSWKTTPKGLKIIGKYQSLESLSLGYTNVTDEDLKSLSGLHNLQFLGLSSTKITDAGLIEVAKHRNLKNLSLDNTAVTDAGLKALAGLKLRSLYLSKSQTTDLALRHYFAAMDPAIYYLDLAGWNISDVNLNELPRFQDLGNLNLTGNNITNAGIRQIAKLKNLNYLNLSATKITDTGVAELSKLRNLRELTIYGTQITDTGIVALRKALPDLVINTN